MTEHKTEKEIVCTPAVESIQGTPQAAIQAPPQLHPLLVAAMEQGGVNVEALERMQEIQFRHEANEARKAYTQAKVALKAALPSAIDHDKKVGYEGKRGGSVAYSFASMAHALDIIQPKMSEFGFSHEWRTEMQGANIKVTCRITHVLGHFEETYLAAPPDDSGKKNPIQAIGSTTTYLERYTLLSALGIATRDMKDTDQHAADDASQRVDPSKNAEAVAFFRERGLPIEEAERHVGRKARDWTAGDRAEIRKLIKDKGWNKKEETLEDLQDKTAIAAQELFGSTWSDGLEKILSTRDKSIATAGKDDLRYALTEINDRLAALDDERK